MDANEQRQREVLHRLIDQIPESTLKEACEDLDLLRLLPHPVEPALRLAPPDDEVYGESERDTWRLRVGDWQVLFEREDASRTLVVLHIPPRGEAYR